MTQTEFESNAEYEAHVERDVFDAIARARNGVAGLALTGLLARDPTPYRRALLKLEKEKRIRFDGRIGWVLIEEE